MAAKKNANTALQQKVKVLAKLYDSGCKTEKDLRFSSLPFSFTSHLSF